MKQALPAAARGKPLEIWFQDEARIGQKGTLTRIWARLGSRPPGPRDSRYEWAYIFAAVCPERATGAALVMPYANTEAMNLHLQEISRGVAPGAHAALIFDGAGWHTTDKLELPENITPVCLPPYLRPAEERWGEIAHYPDLINKYADRLIEMVRRAWSDHQSFQYVTGTSICLSCLLEAGRYDELQVLLATRRTKFWSWHRFGAEALVRQGLWEGAIAFAEGVRDTSNSRFEDNSIDLFCEDLLMQHGRTDEAYRKYGLRATRGTTNLAIYRALVRQYPDLDRRQILLDLIEIRGDKGKWFAAAKDEGFLDIALECAGTHGADPSTLVRAARDFGEAEPRFAASVALMAIGQLLGGGGYNPPLSDAEGAVAYLFTAAQRIGATGWARRELARLGQEPCSPGRELFQDTVRAALFHHDGINSAD